MGVHTVDHCQSQLWWSSKSSRTGAVGFVVKKENGAPTMTGRMRIPNISNDISKILSLSYKGRLILEGDLQVTILPVRWAKATKWSIAKETTGILDENYVRQLCHVYKHANIVVDHLAKTALTMEEQKQVWTWSFPQEVEELIKKRHEYKKRMQWGCIS